MLARSHLKMRDNIARYVHTHSLHKTDRALLDRIARVRRTFDPGN
ncbi:hypothetical protein APHCRT_1462 [Anaplasma phagocytophilum str. CRT53-1]|uniref:Uncharacterized protein n=1 Tax=Anaplasma phagocytophilum str. CRT53-1 TaxID=1359157 RepID=A0A0F3PLJ0_ANAPH|nr:hypothetical protein APHCRT_1462 [Anaplasma phagocytophilum str. CRT53-1]